MTAVAMDHVWMKALNESQRDQVLSWIDKDLRLNPNNVREIVWEAGHWHATCYLRDEEGHLQRSDTVKNDVATYRHKFVPSTGSIPEAVVDYVLLVNK